MAFFANLFKPATTQEKTESQETMERLKKFRGKDTAQWLAKQDRQAIINHAIANGGILPPVGEPPKLEDVDKYDVDESAPYQPPIDVMYTPVSGAVNKNRQAPTQRSTQVDWIETIFDEFAQCAREFNSTIKDQTLMVSVNRPQYSFQASTYDTYTNDAKISIFKGHISTHSWGMLVQGHADIIEVYVVPSENLLAFTLNDIKDRGFKPFMVINSSVQNDQLEWQIENEAVSYDKLPFLAKELFRDLIRIASGKMSETELFASYSEGLKLGETVAKGYSAPANAEAMTAPSPVTGELPTLSTWNLIPQLIKAIENDLAVLNNQENIALDSGNADLVSKLKDASSDLRSLSGGLSELLDGYTDVKHLGAS